MVLYQQLRTVIAKIKQSSRLSHASADATTGWQSDQKDSTEVSLPARTAALANRHNTHTPSRRTKTTPCHARATLPHVGVTGRPGARAPGRPSRRLCAEELAHLRGALQAHVEEENNNKYHAHKHARRVMHPRRHAQQPGVISTAAGGDGRSGVQDNLPKPAPLPSPREESEEPLNYGAGHKRRRWWSRRRSASPYEETDAALLHAGATNSRSNARHVTEAHGFNNATYGTWRLDASETLIHAMAVSGSGRLSTGTLEVRAWSWTNQLRRAAHAAKRLLRLSAPPRYIPLPEHDEEQDSTEQNMLRRPSWGHSGEFAPLAPVPYANFFYEGNNDRHPPRTPAYPPNYTSPSAPEVLGWRRDGAQARLRARQE